MIQHNDNKVFLYVYCVFLNQIIKVDCVLDQDYTCSSATKWEKKPGNGEKE